MVLYARLIMTVSSPFDNIFISEMSTKVTEPRLFSSKHRLESPLLNLKGEPCPLGSLLVLVRCPEKVEDRCSCRL